MPMIGTCETVASQFQPESGSRNGALPALATGTSEFVQLRSQGEAYVDKTAEIARLLAHPAHYLFVGRPRRFGKTLMLSTIECMYQGHLPAPGHTQVDYDVLFEGTAWGERDPKDNDWHPVLRLDMGDIEAANRNELTMQLVGMVLEQARLWRARGKPTGMPHAWLDGEAECPESPGGLLSRLIAALNESSKSAPVILMDEFDTPLMALRDAGALTDVNLGPLRGFLRRFKSEAGSLHKVIMTGITRKAYNHLLSGLNNAEDLTWDPGFALVCGFSDLDLESRERGLGRHVAAGARSLGISEAELRRQLREHYNGYHFDLRGRGPAVYNPWSLVTALKLLETETGTEDVREDGWPSPWVESGSARRLATSLRRSPDSLVGVLERERRLSRDAISEETELGHLLLQTGYLTVKPAGGREPPYATYPNREVEQAFLQELEREYGEAGHPVAFRRLKQAMVSMDFQGLLVPLVTWFHEFPSEKLRNETSLHLLFQALCSFLGLNYTAELHEGGGRPDFAILIPGHACVFKMKYGVDHARAGAAHQQADSRDYGRGLVSSHECVTRLALYLWREGEAGSLHIAAACKELHANRDSTREQWVSLLAEGSPLPEGTVWPG
ncbi:MAG: AAA family ATPase [Caldilineaceae bacterium SB0664_bin_22]|nr:AAA family ATPase [Caldilineaceae bacterium SB0664_bin_22]